MIARIHQYFITNNLREDPKQFRRGKLLVNASLLTSIFSTSYLGISILIDFHPGIVLMIFNMAIFFIIPFLLRLKASLNVVSNLYTGAGVLAIVVLVHYSGGFHSPIYPWLAAGPTIALLIGNRTTAYIWAGLMLGTMLFFGWLELIGVQLTVYYNEEWHTHFSIQVYTGLLLILFIINLVFEKNRSDALKLVEEKNEELKDTLAQLEESQAEVMSTSQQLKQLNEEQEHMIDIMSHDIRSPLNAIEGLVNLINFEKDNLSLEQIECIEQISSSVSRSKELVDRVMEMSEAELNKITFKIETINVSEVLSDVTKQYEALANDKSIEITDKSSDDLVAKGDRTYMVQVFNNLLSNAIKFSPENSKVVISSKQEEGNVLIKVSDNGSGIKDEEKHLLFGKFSKLSNRPTGGENSSGLGLSLVKKYVEMMDGQVWCESVVGEGTSFIVSLRIN